MSVYVYNSLTFEGRDVPAIRARVLNESLEFDFERITPVPPVFDEDAGVVLFAEDDNLESLTEKLQTARGASEKRIRERIQYLENVKEYGFGDWCGWTLHHWGTCINAENTIIHGANLICFETKTSPPLPLIEKLSKEYIKTPFAFAWIYDSEEVIRMKLMQYGWCQAYREVDAESREGHSLALKLGFAYPDEDEDEE